MSKLTDNLAGVICDDCKKKLTDLVLNLKALDKLRPIKTSKRFLNALCPDCKNKAVQTVRAKN